MSSSGPGRWEWPAIAFALALRLWLTAGRTVEVIGWADYDDTWFIRRAQALLDGQWLGPYDHLTLIKGPIYPLWIAVVSTFGIPLLLAQQILYAVACLAVVRAVAPWLRSPAGRILLFVLLLFNPISFADENATRVTREAFYPALSLLVFAGVAGAVLRLDARRRLVVAWLLLCGGALALFWDTREEGVWILPLLAFAGVALLRWMATAWKTRWQRAVLAVTLPALLFAAVHGAFVVTNGLRYGIFEVVEFKERSFLRAYGSLARVRQQRPQARVPVPKEVRERVYAVSPAFAELRPFLEGTLGQGWEKVGNPPVEGEIMGGMFMWAFREAVAEAGHYERGAGAARDYYDRVTREIDQARRSGRLDARPGRATIAPPLRAGQIQDVAGTFVRMLIRIPRFLDHSVGPRYSTGSAAELREYANVTHDRLAPRRKEVAKVRLSGWAVHVEGALAITVEHLDGSPVTGARVDRFPTPGLYEHLARTWKPFPPARHAGLDATAPGPESHLVLRLDERVIERIPLGPDKPVSANPDVRMAIDRYEVETVKPPLRRVDAFRFRVLAGISAVYRLLFLPFFVTAGLLYLRRVLSRTPRDRAMDLLIAGLLAATGARIMILSLINVTSFFALTGAYAAPAYAFFVAAGALMAGAGLSGPGRPSSLRSGSTDRSAGRGTSPSRPSCRPERPLPTGSSSPPPPSIALPSNAAGRGDRRNDRRSTRPRRRLCPDPSAVACTASPPWAARP